jgi:hypothetical protein
MLRTNLLSPAIATVTVFDQSSAAPVVTSKDYEIETKRG